MPTTEPSPSCAFFAFSVSKRCFLRSLASLSSRSSYSISSSMVLMFSTPGASGASAVVLVFLASVAARSSAAFLFLVAESESKSVSIRTWEDL